MVNLVILLLPFDHFEQRTGLPEIYRSSVEKFQTLHKLFKEFQLFLSQPEETHCYREGELWFSAAEQKLLDTSAPEVFITLLLLWLFSYSVVSNSLWPHGLQHTRLPCPSLSPVICSNSWPLSLWCHSTISSSAALFSFCLQSFPASNFKTF